MRPFSFSAIAALALTAGACGPKRPPANYAPDPGLVARIQSLRMYVPEAACPGARVNAEYYAVLDDGTTVPFADRYDDKNPPPLHVLFLTRYSRSALALANGDWQLGQDPVLSAVEGFQLRAALRIKPSVVAEETVRPVYTCQDHVFRFMGEAGGRGEVGGSGPDMTVRIGVVSSPFYDRLIVAGIEVEQAPPFYVFADADQVPPSDWLLIASQGGAGGRGSDGRAGVKGADGQAGCPGTNGGAGGAGGNGGPGGAGGRGGRLTVVVPDDTPFLAGLVEAVSPGGEGGRGGRAGAGGAGGKGGAASGTDRRCDAGTDGPQGSNGSAGGEGPDGPPGVRAQVIQRPLFELYGPQAPAMVRALVTRHLERSGQ